MKKSGVKYHALIVIGVILIALLLLLFVFSASHDAYKAWTHLQQLPPALYYFYLVIIGISIPFSLWVAYKLLEPIPLPKELKDKDNSSKHIAKYIAKYILKDLNKAEKVGLDTSEMRHEIEILETRKKAGTVHVALFGDVSTGKSSIIKALIPEAQLEIRVSGGTTRKIKEYTWISSAGDQLILTDLPGRNEAEGELDLLAQEEAIRAQIVIYVTDSDLSRTQLDDIQQLKDFSKPLLIALNKSDRINKEDRQLYRKKFKTHFPDESSQLLFVQSGGKEEILKIYPDGREETVIRERKADVSSLAQALQNEIDTHAEILDSLRDASVFKLITQKLDNANAILRQKKPQTIIKHSTLKAVLAGLLTISPGSDLVVQGVLGALMLKQLCALYGVPMRQLDIQQFVNFRDHKRIKSILLILIITGNAMKIFPVTGTITGGLIHAAVYGLIFYFWGHAVNKNLKQQGMEGA